MCPHVPGSPAAWLCRRGGAAPMGTRGVPQEERAFAHFWQQTWHWGAFDCKQVLCHL